MSISLLLWLALPAQAASPANPAVPATAVQPAGDGQKLICKRYAESGSNIARKKRCLTRVQWDQTAREAQAMRRSVEQSWTTPNQ